MKEMESFQAGRLIKVFKSPLDSIFVREIMACFKSVGCVEADSHSLVVMNSFDNFFDLVKGIADLCPLSCCILQKENDPILHLFKGLIDPLRKSLNGLIFRCFHSVT